MKLHKISNIMEKFYLKWDQFQINTTQFFSEIREDFFDVTLISKDNQQVELFI